MEYCRVDVLISLCVFNVFFITSLLRSPILLPWRSSSYVLSMFSYLDINTFSNSVPSTTFFVCVLWMFFLFFFYFDIITSSNSDPLDVLYLCDVNVFFFFLSWQYYVLKFCPLDDVLYLCVVNVFFSSYFDIIKFSNSAPLTFFICVMSMFFFFLFSNDDVL